MFNGGATNTNVNVFDLTLSRLDPTIYHTLGEHANYYTTNVVWVFFDDPYDKQGY